MRPASTSTLMRAATAATRGLLKARQSLRAAVVRGRLPQRAHRRALLGGDARHGGERRAPAGDRVARLEEEAVALVEARAQLLEQSPEHVIAVAEVHVERLPRQRRAAHDLL